MITAAAVSTDLYVTNEGATPRNPGNVETGLALM